MGKVVALGAAKRKIARPNPFNPGYWSEVDLRSFGFTCGRNVQIAKNCTIVGRNGGFDNIRIGANVRIDGFTTIIAASGSLTLGSYIHIGGYCLLSCAEDITMADFAGLSQGVKIYTATDDYGGDYLTNPTVPKQFLGVKAAPVHVGRHVVIGSTSVILPGVEIGDGSAVGALSLVARPLAPGGVYAGVPARRIRDRSTAHLALERDLMNETAAYTGSGS